MVQPRTAASLSRRPQTDPTANRRLAGVTLIATAQMLVALRATSQGERSGYASVGMEAARFLLSLVCLSRPPIHEPAARFSDRSYERVGGWSGPTRCLASAQNQD